MDEPRNISAYYFPIGQLPMKGANFWGVKSSHRVKSLISFFISALERVLIWSPEEFYTYYPRRGRVLTTTDRRLGRHPSHMMWVNSRRRSGACCSRRRRSRRHGWLDRRRGRRLICILLLQRKVWTPEERCMLLWFAGKRKFFQGTLYYFKVRKVDIIFPSKDAVFTERASTTISCLT